MRDMYKMSKLKIKKITAVVTVAAVLLVMLGSFLFIAQHAHHDCTGEDCPICVHIRQFDMMLRGLETGPEIAADFFAFVLFVNVSIPIMDLFVTEKTPVSEKIRLND